jgi:molecular chaperone GrpE
MYVICYIPFKYKFILLLSRKCDYVGERPIGVLRKPISGVITVTEKEKFEDVSSNGDGVSIDDENIEMVEATETDANEQEVSDPEQQIAQMTAELTSEREKYLRALADLDNLRKRSRRDVEEARISGRMNVLEEMLPALDSIDMALKSVAPTEANQAVYDGMLMVQRQFMTSMEKFSLKRVAAMGEPFNPAVHEAVSYVPSPTHRAGEVMAEMRTGYLLGEKLLRASMVVVSSGPPQAAADENQTQDTPSGENSESGAESDCDSDASNGQE